MDSGHLGDVSPTGSADGWDVMLRAKEKSKTTLRVLARAPERLELSFAEMWSTLG